jgi:hypothetical protein
MFKTKKWLIIIFLIVHQNAWALPFDLTGRWCWEKSNKHSSFSLTFKKYGSRYKGSYRAVILDGNRTDGNDEAFDFKELDTTVIQTKMITGWEMSVALVQLKLLSNNQMEWVIIKRPYGTFSVPYDGKLNRC